MIIVLTGLMMPPEVGGEAFLTAFLQRKNETNFVVQTHLSVPLSCKVEAFCRLARQFCKTAPGFVLDNRNVFTSVRIPAERPPHAVLVELHERLAADGRVRALPAGNGGVRLHIPDGPQTEVTAAQRAGLVHAVRRH